MKSSVRNSKKSFWIHLFNYKPVAFAPLHSNSMTSRLSETSSEDGKWNEVGEIASDSPPCYKTSTCPIPKCTFASDKEQWKPDMEAHLFAHFYRRVCGCGESFVTNSQIDNHMRRKGKGDPSKRRTQYYFKYPKKNKASLRTWGLFKQRTGIPIPDQPPTPKFGNKQREVTAAMPPLVLAIDVNKIAT